jgi:predicted ester cyclase
MPQPYRWPWLASVAFVGEDEWIIVRSKSHFLAVRFFLGRCQMASIVETAKEFFTACETGKGWDGCKAFCKPNATFSAQAEPLTDVKTLQQYADWMKAIYTPLPNASYDIKSFAVDRERNNVAAYAVFSATNTGPGGPPAPTGKSTRTDYVYVMQFEGDKISHMTKIWNAGMALRELGWA